MFTTVYVACLLVAATIASPVRHEARGFPVTRRTAPSPPGIMTLKHRSAHSSQLGSIMIGGGVGDFGLGSGLGFGNAGGMSASSSMSSSNSMSASNTLNTGGIGGIGGGVGMIGGAGLE
ncbi:hypothetical protein KEM48_013808 [Puccinia striiformis f. sp. tritici PST-130]|nr:hypothetical protein KEM48_013808 [Puccinia striiformis f. sp. tritici PST-130]